ncbi:MAG: lipopolysaccharide biosynthesis protein [bacterium]
MSIKRNSSYLFGARIAGFFLTMVDSVVISRCLGPDQRGIYILILVINYMATNFGNCGLDFTNTYELAKRKNTIAQVHSHSLVLIALVSILAFVLYFLFQETFHSTLVKSVSSKQVLIALGLIPFSLYIRYWGAIMAGFERFKLTSILNTCTGFINTAGIVTILLILKGGVNELLIWMLIAYMLFSSIRVGILKVYGELGFDFSWQRFWNSLSFGLKGHVGNIATYIILRFDNFVLNSFCGPGGVGIYSLAVSLAEKIHFVPQPILSAAAPRISSTVHSEATRLTAVLIRHTLIIGLLLALILALTVPWLLPLIYGVEYRDSVLPLLIMLPGMIAVMAGTGFSSYVTFQLGKPQITSLVAWCNLAVTLPMMFLMIRSFGVLGAAWTTTISYMLIIVVNGTLFLKFSGERFRVLVPRYEDLKVYTSLAGNVYSRIFPRLSVAKSKV